MNTAQRALLDLLVIAAVADGEIDDSELEMISSWVRWLPVFHGVDAGEINEIAEDCVALLADPEGIPKLMDRTQDALPVALHDTAYSLVVEIVSADSEATPTELELLNLLRETLSIDDLSVAAIQYASRARHRAL